LYDLLPKIPPIGGTRLTQNPKTFLHYHTPIHDYNIFEYDGENTLYGRVTSNVFPAETEYQTISLSNLMKNRLLKLEVSVT